MKTFVLVAWIDINVVTQPLTKKLHPSKPGGPNTEQ